ncbi:metallophosphoesterase [Caminicella sporogenes]|uniref:metallophosphoesterase n=1 Tax=Caminicella sporogenes TaxID=166485 RepID=UPI00253F6AAF|nr:metallophosphoesterase [Caminicella sporogenes]WIF94082.1 metallophosphoesterase [Caminicella sporogenes]
MKIGIISDTHGDYKSIYRAIEDMGSVDFIIHAGDTYEDAMMIKEKFGFKVIAVRGNTDYKKDFLSEMFFTIKNKKIFLTHGHKYDVKYNLTRLYYKAQELGADIVIFGHSHIPQYIWESGILFINPGSVSRPRMGNKATYGLLELKKDDIDVQLITLI